MNCPTHIHWCALKRKKSQENSKNKSNLRTDLSRIREIKPLNVLIDGKRESKKESGFLSVEADLNALVSLLFCRTYSFDFKL